MNDEKIKSVAKETAEKKLFSNEDIDDKKDKEIGKSYAALNKLYQLLCCGDKRIELSAAKEIIGLLGVPEEIICGENADKLEVEIKVI